MAERSSGSSDGSRSRRWRWGRFASKKHRRSSARRAVLLLLVIGLGAIGAAAWLGSLSAERIASGVSIAGLDVGRMEVAAAEELVRQRVLTYKMKVIGLSPELELLALATPERPALADFDVRAAAQQAYAVGREGNSLEAALGRARAYAFGHDVAVPIKLRRDLLAKELNKAYATEIHPAQNAGLTVSVDAAGNVTTQITPETEGTVLDVDGAVSAATQRLVRLSDNPITVRLIHDRPLLKTEAVEPLEESVGNLLARAPFRLSVGKKFLTVTKGILADWLVAQPPKEGEQAAWLSVDKEKMAAFLQENAGELITPATDAVFEMADKRVVKFVPSTDGETFDTDKLEQDLDQALFAIDTTEVADIVVDFRVVTPDISTAEANPYGIKEVIGVGESNFRGSPTNRRTNIKVGAGLMNGLIIMPDEEFSTIKSLLPIDGEHGFLQELVIKKDKTVPEYGGGLCQIGTTMFRAALAAGLPITQRQNHSYRVPYYERDGSGAYMGPGKDATIYDPWPDLKFKNDTGRAIILQTAVKGDRVTFTIWGVKDGRVAEQSAARVWNTVPPPEKKIIETTELEPGKVKCTESPHPGADAAFTYTVTYADGNVVKKDFTSHYRPWGEVCLVGVDPSKIIPEGGVTLSADAAGAAGN